MAKVHPLESQKSVKIDTKEKQENKPNVNKEGFSQPAQNLLDDLYKVGANPSPGILESLRTFGTKSEKSLSEEERRKLDLFLFTIHTVSMIPQGIRYENEFQKVANKANDEKGQTKTSVKFKNELKELKSFLSDPKKIKEITGDPSSLKKQLMTIQKLENMNPQDDVINSMYISFETMSVEQLLEYFKTRETLAKLKVEYKYFIVNSESSQLKFMSEYLMIPQLTISDQKEVMSALNVSIKYGTQMIVNMKGIVSKTYDMIGVDMAKRLISSTASSYEGLQKTGKQYQYQRASSNAHQLLVANEQGGMEVYQNKVNEIRNKYTPCCNCSLM